VVRPYGQEKLVSIADQPSDFVRLAESAMLQRSQAQWLGKVDQFLSGMSWDRTWTKMAELEHDLAILKTKRATRRRSGVYHSTNESAGLN
jgi:UDP-galactopyranose mutase